MFKRKDKIQRGGASFWWVCKFRFPDSDFEIDRYCVGEDEISMKDVSGGTSNPSEAPIRVAGSELGA
jgi:hypothetical protein